jgi:hypothetical protein
MNWLFLFLALGLLLWFIALFRLKAYIKRRTGADYALGNLREEIRLLEADIDEKTEQNLALLEEKINEVRELCTETEKRIAVYARELARKNAEEAAFAALDPQKIPAVSAAPSLEDPRRKKTAGKKRGRKNQHSLFDSIEVQEITAGRAAKAYQTQARQRSSVLPAKTGEDRLPAEALPAAQGRQAPRPREPRFTVSANPVKAKAPPMKERVAELYRAGFSEDLVAARLGISITEARLYIAMASGR